MYHRMFVCLIYSISLAEACVWKESFKFHLDGAPFDRTPLHIQLSNDVQQKVEDWPHEVYAGGGDRPVRHDNVGNLFFIPSSLHVNLSTPTNKENLALASLEVILKNSVRTFSSQLYHLEDEIGGRNTGYTRFFWSRRSHLSDHAYDRLNSKIGYNLPSKPSSFDTNDFGFYHKAAHSEDKIFYLLSRVYRRIIRDIFHKRKDVNERIRAVILHVHSRFDMCGSCAYSLDWELKEGFGRDILNFCRMLNGNSRLPVDISSFVSSRQEYLVWGPSRRTLPVPPLLRDPSLSNEQLQNEYKRIIDFSADLSGPKTFAQSVILPFVASI